MIKVRIFIFIVITLFYAEKLSAQEDSTKEYLQIYLKEFSVYFQPDSCIDKMEVDLLSNGKIIVDLFDCEGRMSFKVFNSKKKLVTEGAYTNSLDTLKKYSIGKSAINGSRKIEVLRYFQPLPNGVWKYYKDGKKIKQVRYINGILESTN